MRDSQSCGRGAIPRWDTYNVVNVLLQGINKNMGISKQQLVDFEWDIIHNYGGLEWTDIHLCELGCQVYKIGGKLTAKKVYLERGVKEHISIDLNGRRGSIPLDLDVDFPKSYHNRFDVVTDYGTGEHVNDQYSLFRNKFLATKHNGLIINALPKVNSWKHHCRYHYNKDIMYDIAEVCGFKILKLDEFSDPTKKRRLVILSAFQKVNDSFPTREEFNESVCIFDNGELKNTGNYYDRRRERQLQNKNT